MADTLDTVKNAQREGSRAMPSNSPKQARTMAAAAHSPQFAKKVGIPQGVAQDFNKADTGSAQLRQAMKDRAKKQPPQRYK
jgi:hypothetical protein